jgi:aminomethyltransferase
VQYAVTNDITKLEDGRALYTVMCQEDGGIVDDLIVYRESAERYLLVVNAGRHDEDVEHLRAVTARFACTLTDRSDDYALIAFQGPKALGVLAGLTTAPVATMKPFTFVDAPVAGIRGVRIARTGYTGEDGVELFCAPADAPRLWAGLEGAGQSAGVVPVGLGARDTLRLEMKFALYGHDIDEQHDPIAAGLGWVVKLDKGDFLGRARLVDIKTKGPAQKLVGFRMRARGGVPRQGYPIRVGGRDAGVVTSGTHSPSLGEPIGIGWVPAAAAAVGTALEIVIRDRPVAAEVVKTPFYKRESAT